MKMGSVSLDSCFIEHNVKLQDFRHIYEQCLIIVNYKISYNFDVYQALLSDAVSVGCDFPKETVPNRFRRFDNCVRLLEKFSN